MPFTTTLFISRESKGSTVINLRVVESTVHEDYMGFGDIAGQVGDRVVDGVVIRHAQDPELADGTVVSLHATGTLVDSRQILRTS